MMTKREKELIEWFENTDLGDELLEAKKNGDLIVTKAGENPIEAIKRHIEAKKKVPVSLRLSTGVVNKFKSRAVSAGIPWTSYMGTVLEQAVAEN